MNISTPAKHRLVGDFESYYGKELSLTKVTVPEYVFSPLFQIIGAAFKFNDEPIQWFTGEQQVRDYLNTLPWDEGIEFVAHNAMFDGSIMEWALGFKPQRYFCTMMGSRPFVTPFTGKMSLAKVAEYLKLPEKGTEVQNAYNMRLGDFSPEALRRYADYCIHDTNLCDQIEQWLRPKYPEDEAALLSLTIGKFLRSPLRLDGDLMAERLLQIRAEKEQMLDDLGMADRKALMSNDLFAQTLEALGVEAPRKISPRTGKETYAFAKSDKAFTALLEHDDLRVQALVAARLKHKSTIEETRIERLLSVAGATGGKLPVPLLYYGAHTGRLSGYDKINLQNLSRGSALRAAIIAPPGKLLVAADLSQIEARIVAWLADQQDLVDAFANKEDIYSQFATKAFGYKVTKETHPQERFVGKTCILGLGYGMGHNKLQLTLSNGGVTMTEMECRRIVQLYRNTYNNIPRLWSKAEGLLPVIAGGAGDVLAKLGPVTAVKGQMLLPNGMAIVYPELHTTTDGWIAKPGGKPRNLWGGAVVENIVQALARIVISNAELRLAYRGLPAALQVHDELVYAVPEGQAQKYGQAVELAMTAGVEWAPGLPVECEVGIGGNYRDAK